MPTSQSACLLCCLSRPLRVLLPAQTDRRILLILLTLIGALHVVMASFTLHHLLLACMFTGVVVSLLVSGIHSQWALPAHSTLGANIGSTNTGGSNADSARMSAMRLRVDQLSNELAAAKSSASSPNASPTFVTDESQCPPCEACDEVAQLVPAATSATPAAATEDALAEYIELHRRILAKEPGVEQRFIIGPTRKALDSNTRA